MLRCTQARAMFSKAVDGYLDPASKREFDAHVEACADCARELRAQGAAWELLAVDDAHPAPADLARRVLASTPASGSRQGVRLAMFAPVLRSGLAAACVAVAVLAGGLLGYWATARGTDAGQALARSGVAGYLSPASPLRVSGAFAGLHAEPRPGVE